MEGLTIDLTNEEILNFDCGTPSQRACRVFHALPCTISYCTLCISNIPQRKHIAPSVTLEASFGELLSNANLTMHISYLNLKLKARPPISQITRPAKKTCS